MKNHIFHMAATISLICVYSSVLAQWQNQTVLSDNPPLCSVSTVNRDVIWTIGYYQSNVYRTNNGGQTWIKKAQVPTKNYLNTIEALDSITAFIGTYHDVDSGAIYRTKDGGQSWQLVYNAPSKNNKYVDWIHFFDAQNGIAEFNQEVVPNHTCFIVKTIDGGDTWTPITNQPTGNDRGWENVVHFYDSLNGWFGTSGGRVFRTTDGGNNWTASSTGTGGYVLAVRFISPMVGIRTASSSPFLSRSNDGGQTWTPVNNPPFSDINEIWAATSISTPSINQFWVYGMHGSTNTPFIMTSIDDGIKWQEQTMPELLEDNFIFHMSAVTFGTLNDSVQAFAISVLHEMINTSGGQILNYRQPIGLGGIPSRIQPEYAVENILLENYPNPFNSQTTFEFVLPEQGKVTLTIYNALGQEVENLLEVEMSPGSHQVIWDAKNYDSGVYFCNLTTKNFSQIRRMVLLR